MKKYGSLSWVMYASIHKTVLCITVAFARLLFPSEAKVAMHIANAEKTSQFAGFSASKGVNGNFREVDLNETPMIQKKRLLSRLEELNKTGMFMLFLAVFFIFFWI